MRVTQNTTIRLYTQQTQDARQTIAKLQEQIASGQRLLQPSDDPLGVGKSVQVEQTLSQVKQYQRNGDFVDSRLSMEETALRNMTDSLTSLREIALRTNNDTLAPQDHTIYLDDLSHRHEEMLGYINSQGANGEYLFSGTERTVKPIDDAIVYQGNHSAQSINIGLNSKLKIGTPAPDVLEFDTASGTTDVFTTINQLQTLIKSASTDNKPADFSAQMAVLIEHLDDAQTHMASLQADVGHRLARLDSTREDNTEVELMLNTDLNDIKGLDFADAITKFEGELQALEAIQSSYARINNLSLFNFVS